MIAGGKMLLFYQDDDVLRYISRCAERFSINLQAMKVLIEDLPAYPYAERLLSGCKATDIKSLEELPIVWREKGLSHYHRDFLDSGEDAYRQIISIWMSKIALVADHAVVANPFDTPEFAWIDASVSRFNGRRQNWNFSKAPPSEGKLLHYANRMRYYGELLPINASCMIAEAEVWRTISRLFSDALDAHANDSYAHDEETILGYVYKNYPELFACLGLNHTGRREQIMGKPHALIRRLETWRTSLGNLTDKAG